MLIGVETYGVLSASGMSAFFFLKGSVAKKPYNPILGETFRCFWVLPEVEASRTEVRSEAFFSVQREFFCRNYPC